jgi:hypothetical protein
METSVVFVSWGTDSHKHSDPAQQEARYSTHLTMKNEHLKLVRPVVGPRPWLFYIGHAVCFEAAGPEMVCKLWLCAEH